MIRLLSVLLVSACASYDSTDDACPNKLGGSSGATDDAIHYYQRVNCHRRYAGLYKIRVNYDVQKSVENHVLYMEAHYDPSLPWSAGELSSEDPAKSLFTGENDYARIVALGDTVVSVGTHGAWFHPTTDIPEDRGPFGWADVVDLEMSHFIFRQKHLQPSSFGVGMAVAGPWRYAFDLYQFPSSEAVNRPVVYPVDGQVDVPTSTFNPWESDLPAGQHGYHITVTVGGIEGESWLDQNPYGLTSSELELVDEDGEPVEFWLITPNSLAPGPFLYSIALVPKQPLEPNTTYSFSGRVAWQGLDKKVETTFTTGS